MTWSRSMALPLKVARRVQVRLMNFLRLGSPSLSPKNSITRVFDFRFENKAQKFPRLDAPHSMDRTLWRGGHLCHFGLGRSRVSSDDG